MEKWIVTGISGSGRIELLNELEQHATTKGKSVLVHSISDLIQKECRTKNIPFTDKRILDLDINLLGMLRSSALKQAIIDVYRQSNVDYHLIGTHATFRWKHRLIPGVSYSDLMEFKPDGFVNIVDDVKTVLEINKKNPKWDPEEVPDAVETQEWMMEEEYVTEVLASVFDRPMYLVSRNHKISNLADLFFTNKKKVYLSYPITAVRKENPDLLERIQGEILEQLENLFVVFDPLGIKDMELTYQKVSEQLTDLPDSITKLDDKSKKLIKSRTVARDFRFIDQADAIVVFYLTEKLSPGVLAEIFYAHRNQKPVFMVFPYSKSPFIETTTTYIEDTIDKLVDRLKEFAEQIK